MKYSQTTGQLTGDDGAVLGTGYSGNGAGLNNPAMQDVIDRGPLPQGIYTVGHPLNPPDHLGPLAMPLTPDPSNEMHGRSGFFMHGDNSRHDQSASEGCIIMPQLTRLNVSSASDRTLEVTP
jgi:hypothetical protein